MVVRSIVAMVALLALVLTGSAWGYLRATDNGFAQVAALDENSTDVVDPGGQTGDETYLIVGTDTRAGANSKVGAGTADEFEGFARSDTIMLVNIPANRQRVVVVSFPRDLDVHRPACQRWDNSTSSYTNEMIPAADGDKLNATYAVGGPKCLVKVIQKLSGLKIGHFVGMDFAGFESMVNEVGGVQVCTSTPLTDGELGPILTTTGVQTINGATALNYVRARNIVAEGNGDYGRIKRQQRFLSSLLRSALSNKVLLDPGKLNGFISAFTRDTFVEKVTTQDLVTLGRSLQNVDAGDVTFLTVPTAGTNDYGNEIPRLDDVKAIFQAIINDDPLPGEKGYSAPAGTGPTGSSAPPTTTSTSGTDSSGTESSSTSTSAVPTTKTQVITRTAVAPSSVSVQVSNASGIAGQAAETANSLGALGFRIYTVGNYSETTETSLIRYSPGQETEAATLASAIPGAVLQPADDLGSIVEVVLGSEFGGSVQRPQPVGSSVTATEATAPTPQLPTDLAHVNAADRSCD